MIDDLVIRDALLLAFIWIAYFAIHSLLASLTIKNWVSQRFQTFMPLYRLSFNLIASVSILIPAWLLYTGEKTQFWAYSGIAMWIMHGLTVLAIIAFLVSMRYYDGQEFLGLRQLREKETRVEDQENLQISPFHRHVRHPWYSIALVLIWTRSMDSLMLTTAVLLTAYFFLGSRLEERKLVAYYGDVYSKYMQQVPGLIPLPWHYLKLAEAQSLIHEYQTTQARPENH